MGGIEESSFNWGRRTRMVQTCITVMEFCSMGAPRDCRSVVAINGDRTHNWWRIPLIRTVANIYKPWVLRQNFCVVSPMQWESWTLLEMGKAPHWMFFLTYIHLSAWDQGGVGGCGLLSATKIRKNTIMNIARPILACLKEIFSSHISQEHAIPSQKMLC